MGVEIVLGISLAISIGATVASLVMTPRSKQKMRRGTENIQITQAEEGQCVPIVFGTVRVPGSIIWYGNTLMKPKKPAGSKGGGGSGGAENFKVYTDVHIVLCEGKITLEKVYKDEEEYTPPASITFNDGTGSIYENYAEFATKLAGIAHYHLKGWFLGENNYSVPALSFKVKRIVTGCPLSSTVTTGENPAVIVWDLLNRLGATIDSDSFERTCLWYNTRNIGLNLVFNEQQELSKMIEKIRAHVDIILYNVNGVFYLREMQEYEAVVLDVLEDEITDFTFTRIAYNQVLNDFAANYIDENNTQRTARLINDAVFNIVGTIKNNSYDFNGFNSLQVVKDRLADIAKRESFPLSEISFQMSLRGYELVPGDIITLSIAKYGMTEKKYRVMEIEKNVFENNVKIVAREFILDNMIALGYEVGTPAWADPNYQAEDLTKVVAINFRFAKYADWSGKAPTLIAAVQKKGVETAYDVYYSRDNISYQYLQTCFGFFYHGTLKELYPDNTYGIDDTNGILIEFDESKYALDTLTRDELFTKSRIIVINGEVMKFQYANPEGDNLRLFGVLRGDNPRSHAVDSDVFIGDVLDNVVYLPFGDNLYLKVCPKTFRGGLDIGNATAFQHNAIPNLFKPSRLLVTRSGNNFALEIWPNINNNRGYGVGDPDIVTDSNPHPFDFVGSFIVAVASNAPITLNTTIYNFTYGIAGIFSISVYQYLQGFTSEAKTIVIGEDDGEYIV